MYALKTLAALSIASMSILPSTPKVNADYYEKEFYRSIGAFNSTFSNRLLDGYGTEYLRTRNTLVEYSCHGYLKCISNPERMIIDKKYYPKSDENNTNILLVQHNQKIDTDSFLDPHNNLYINPNLDWYKYYMKKGKKFFEQKNYSEAKIWFGQAVASKKSAEAYLNRGFSNYMLNDYISAIYDFGRVNEITPNNSNAYFYKGLSQIYEEVESQNKLEILKGCQNINRAKELGLETAKEFLRKNKFC